MKAKELNLPEILQDCPAGTNLYSPLFGDVTFVRICIGGNICVRNCYGCLEEFYSNGKRNNCPGECMIFPSKENRDWSTWKNPKPKVERFDPKTLKTFDKVLVRDSFDMLWIASFFSSQEINGLGCVNGTWRNCIPYNEETKYLVGTSDDAPEYYKYWED